MGQFQMTVRPLRLDEASAASALHNRAFDTGWPVADFQDHIENDTSLGCYDGTVLRGLIILRTIVPQAEVLTVAVDTDARQRGAGRALMTAGEASVTAQGNRVIFLEVAEDNEAAISMYRSLGYVPFGRRPGYYKRANGRVAALNFSKNVYESPISR